MSQFQKLKNENLYQYPAPFSQVGIDSECELTESDLLAMKAAIDKLSESAWMLGLSLDFVVLSGRAPKP